MCFHVMMVPTEKFSSVEHQYTDMLLVLKDLYSGAGYGTQVVLVPTETFSGVEYPVDAGAK